MGGRACTAVSAVPDGIPGWIACSWQFQAFATQPTPPLAAVQELLWWASDTDADMGLELLELLIVARPSLSLMFSLTRTADGGAVTADSGEAGNTAGNTVANTVANPAANPAATEADDSCAICFEDMTAATMEVLDTCAHVFCHDCVALMSGGGAADVTCPLCRQVSWWAPVALVPTAAVAVVVPPPPAVDSCPVCLEDVAVAEMDVLARCRHAFCCACTDRLCNADGQITCPLCRAVSSHSRAAVAAVGVAAAVAATNSAAGSAWLQPEYGRPSGAYNISRGSDWRLWEDAPSSGGPGNASNLEDRLYTERLRLRLQPWDTQPWGGPPLYSSRLDTSWPVFPSAPPADRAAAIDDLWEGGAAGSVALPPMQPAMEFPQAAATARRLQPVRRLGPRALQQLAGPAESLRDRERRLLALDTSSHDDAFSSASASGWPGLWRQ